jgi:hypothetical protein
MPLLQPPQGLLLVVGREEFTAPTSFGGLSCAATVDCVAVATAASVSAGFHDSPGGLVELATFELECEGMLSLRDVWGREHDAMGVEPGLALVSVYGDELADPTELVVLARPA